LPTPALPSFPTRRSSDLAPSANSTLASADGICRASHLLRRKGPSSGGGGREWSAVAPITGGVSRCDSVPTTSRQRAATALVTIGDRKSTRLNSSHLGISY